jgi:GNAT superfamily N-acetyltransferase
MTVSMRALEERDIDVVVEFSVRAWAPVFESMCAVMGRTIFSRVYPDWRPAQARAVESVIRDEGSRVWVAESGGRLAGFVAVVFHDRDGAKSGEIEMVAVDPDFQNQGIGLTLVSWAVGEIGKLGIPLVEIGTGGDPGHAPARHVYEKAGFTPLPLVRYYKALDTTAGSLRDAMTSGQAAQPTVNDTRAPGQ